MVGSAKRLNDSKTLCKCALHLPAPNKKPRPSFRLSQLKITDLPEIGSRNSNDLISQCQGVQRITRRLFTFAYPECTERRNIHRSVTSLTRLMRLHHSLQHLMLQSVPVLLQQQIQTSLQWLQHVSAYDARGMRNRYLQG